MQRVVEVLPPGSWAEPAADRITLDHDARHRRRIVLTSDTGIAFLLDEPHPVVLRDGGGLRLEDGRIVAVIAQPEPLLHIRAADPAALLRLAWHVGNRHLAAQIAPDHLLIRQDHVIAAMLAGLGATVSPVLAPFDPEGGAYGGAHHAHDH